MERREKESRAPYFNLHALVDYKEVLRNIVIVGP